MSWEGGQVSSGCTSTLPQDAEEAKAESKSNPQELEGERSFLCGLVRGFMVLVMGCLTRQVLGFYGLGSGRQKPDMRVGLTGFRVSWFRFGV